MLDSILDRNQSPVARMRLLSGGVHLNNRLEKGGEASGDAGCLACGNCVDNCPVVSEKYRFVLLQNQRTSMSLENMVGDECRRCYRCVTACPQVEKSIKEYASAFRKGEKIVHLITAAAIIGLAATGITLSHYRVFLPALEVNTLGILHRLLGVVLFFMPLAYWIVDKKHMVGMMRSITHWDAGDKEWARAMIRHVKDPGNNGLPSIYQFNPAQKFWACYLIFFMFPILSLTGFARWYWLAFSPGDTVILVTLGLIHMTVALMTDLFLFLHIYFKYIRSLFRLSSELATCFLRYGHFMSWTLYKAEGKRN